MELAMGALGWRPVDFWGATPVDLSAAINGWRKTHGVKNGIPDMTPEELVVAYEELLAHG